MELGRVVCISKYTRKVSMCVFVRLFLYSSGSEKGDNRFPPSFCFSNSN